MRIGLVELLLILLIASLTIGPSAALWVDRLSLIHISEPTRRTPISYAVFCLKKKKVTYTHLRTHETRRQAESSHVIVKIEEH